ncbi:related to translocation protein sec62 [Sporisorium reilianum f. sp. reilianum]|uniref:Translocation protein SEC62 n=1 Tax=Sporisorium reilianum f. sp. reilianum TaxID=72559 RepID=A0A2N8UDE4_9BASI|nr:related to translocation protein sec62 [Sporisorium reilianum f. sp. reilianum]
MTKARRRNLRATAAAPPPFPSTPLSRPKPTKEPVVEASAGVPLDCVEVDADAHSQLDLKSFIDMTSHSADFTSPPLPARKPNASSCCPADDENGAFVSYISQEQQSSAPPPARNVVNFLRNKSGLKTRVGALNGKRVDYFKGSAAVKALLSPAYAKLKDVPKVTNKDEAEECLHNIIPFAFFLRVERGASTGGKDSPKVVDINPQQMFKSDLYYVWLYEGSQLGLKLAGLGMVAVMLAGVMFPLWPPTMRLGVWYLSVGALGLIGLFFAIAIVRLIFWLITVVVAKPGIWIFPNLFEDVGFVDSFIPLWAWDVPPAPKKKNKPASAAAAEKKKPASGSGAGAGARQQALAGVGGAPPSTVQPPKPAPRAAESKPAEPNATQASGSGGPGAEDSLDDIN